MKHFLYWRQFLLEIEFLECFLYIFNKTCYVIYLIYDSVKNDFMKSNIAIQ